MYTGFGKISRNLLSYLFSTGKYEIFEYAQGVAWSYSDLQKLPWQAAGTLPNSQHEINELNKDPYRARQASYGEYNIEKAIELFKPDICIFNQDTWGNSYAVNRHFHKIIPTVLWTTHDSLPLLKTSYKDASKTPYYWNWSSFATNEFSSKKVIHTKTQYPPVDLDYFFPLDSQQRKRLRNLHKINDEYIIGFVFRNQLRKLVPNLMEGFSMLQTRNPEIKSKLLLVTNFSEGWKIPDLAKQYGVKMDDVLTPYVSKSTGKYYILPYSEQEIKNPETGENKDLTTVNIIKGVTDEQLNEIYNIMDVYCHPATSGACELPCVESAAAGKIVLTANYSFGEDVIKYNKGSYELDYSKYTEFGTQFVKSSVSPNSIAKQLAKVYNLNSQDKASKEKLSREWAISFYDKNTVGKQIEEFIDSLPLLDYEKITLSKPKKNPDFQPDESLKDKEYILSLYSNILLADEDEDGDGFKYWMNILKNGGKRHDILEYFRKVARDDNQKAEPLPFDTLIDFERKNKRLLLILKESIGDQIMFSSLLPLIKEKYENCDIYLACEEKYHNIYAMNQNVYKVIPWMPFLENEPAIVGYAGSKKYFDHLIHVAVETQRTNSYYSKIS